ncbi:proteasome accessory factor PafA2 family protein [Luteococcus sp.]|uniref:proteasome accessory factor PafA2 family protein n=1 Tax=Luteococcus sp. TaxID=1969402 RepID=UPI003736D4FE
MSIMGLETEYGVVVTGLAPGEAQPDPISLSEAVIAAVDAAGTSFSLADEQPLVDARGTVLPRHIAHPDLLTDQVTVANRLLANGGRSYVDHAHPEWSGPEVTTATEALVWDRAGDQLHTAAARAASQRTGLAIHLVKNTTDNKGRSYGRHENHLLPRSLPFETIVEQFPGFLASRVVVNGAGRVGIGEAGERPGFQTSQRADFFERLVGLETTLRRPIINTRDEPHADRATHRRLHVITGDANLCHVATLVTIGSASLALRAITAGARLPQPVDPVAAMRAWSHDPSCTVRQPCTDGTARTAVELQQLWAHATEEHLSSEDDALVQRHWRGILDDLAVDPMRCADRLDWVVKLRLLQGLCQRHGFGWDDPRLQALDLRYADLTDGLFARLESSGAVQTIVDDGDVTAATTRPPVTTRAWLRGTLLERFGTHVVAASWDRIVLATPQGERSLQLVQPFDGTAAQWHDRIASTTTIDELTSLFDSLGWRA